MSGGLRGSNTKRWLVAGAVLLVLLAAAAGYFFWQYMTLKNDPMAANKETAAKITAQVGQVLQLPEGEEPEVAKVTDTSKIKDQPFFAKAEVDDYVIVYQKSQLAILYREKTRKLINVDYVEISSGAGADKSTN